MLGHPLDANSRGQYFSFLVQLSWITFPSHQFPVSSSVIGCVPRTLYVQFRYQLPSECTSCKVDNLPEAHCTTCTWTSRDRSQRPLVVTKLPLPPEPAWKSPISNGWETLSSCHPSLCYYVNLIFWLWDIMKLKSDGAGLIQMSPGKDWVSAQAEGIKSMWAVQHHQLQWIKSISSQSKCISSKSPKHGLLVAQKVAIARQRPDLDLIETQK